MTELVEAMHRTIAAVPGPLGTPPEGPTTGTTGFVYGSVRGVTRLVGSGVDAALARLAPLLGEASPSPGRDALLAALNGVLGDHLEATGNPLAIRMRLRPHEDRLAKEPAERVVLLVHGLCMSDAGWNRAGHDHGAALEHDLGYTPVYLRYNTGRHISANGRDLAHELEAFVAGWPSPLRELSLVTHSVGGLVSRSALHYAAEAGLAWPRILKSVVFLGTPHHGAPLERVGKLLQAALGVSPYSLPFARLGKLRSAGITDLGHGNLLDEDWAGRDRFARRGDLRRPLPLPSGIAFHAIAAATGLLASDGLVPVASALGRHPDPTRALAFPPSRTWIAPDMNHFDLLSRPEVYTRIRGWLSADG